MAVGDPFVSLGEWRRALYRGDQPVIELFLKEIEATLPSGWRRDAAYDSTWRRPDHIRCYRFDEVEEAAVRVWLERATATRVRGGPVQVLRHPPAGDAGRIGELVADFADGCVLLAARSVGILRTRPGFGPMSHVTAAAETQFTQFADTVDGAWPLVDQSRRIWDDLYSVCLAEGVAIDRDELRNWFEASGWDCEAALALVDRFFADSAWLAERLDFMAR